MIMESFQSFLLEQKLEFSLSREKKAQIFVPYYVNTDVAFFTFFPAEDSHHSSQSVFVLICLSSANSLTIPGRKNGNRIKRVKKLTQRNPNVIY